MLRRRQRKDYQPVRRSRRASARKDERSVAENWPAGVDAADAALGMRQRLESSDLKKAAGTFLKRGHAFSYAALLLFTIILYARPAEFYPSGLTASIALVVGVVTLAVFVPSQLSLEGSLTARPREVSLVLLFCLTGLLSIPLAIDPAQAWHEFSDTFIRCIVIFVVMVNVVRTEKRLNGLLLLALATGIWLSLGAINDYRLGLMTVEGYRAGGRGGGIFGNSNDMALFLVTIVPIAIALLLSSRSLARKFLFGGCAVLMVSGIVLTYSRGGFIGLLVALTFSAWKAGQRRRLEIVVVGFLIVAAFLALVPGYALRLASILVPSLDPLGSSEARSGELVRSLYVAIRHPIFGIGMGNYAPEMSYRGLVTHNSYTQVAAEMGMAALVCYTMFIVTPLKKLGQIAREAFGAKANSHFYYLAVGLQASLVGYMVCSFFASVAYLWYVYYLVAYAVCLRRLYESETGKAVVLEKQPKQSQVNVASVLDHRGGVATI
ncbi:MAG TPA: O-antigen ligase family protein [Pyrinomonadaceae bacterium]|nr:O-antigen ligase family protein [Pyrinomonadaceae bacterium]